MTESEALDQLHEILDALNIMSGDTVYLGIDMSGVPLPEYEIGEFSTDAMRAREQKWCEFVYAALMNRLGKKGTLLVPTFSYVYARHGTPYQHESTPSETGLFTEYVRQRPHAFRSLHPLNSIAGVGVNSETILADTGKAGYGVSSPFARLREFETKFLFLGVSVGRALTYAHHLEHMYGVNHMYHKLYNTDVMAGGQKIDGPWLCFVRYLSAGVEPEIGNLETEMRSRSYLREYTEWPNPMQCCTVDDVERVALDMLNESPFAFIRNPVEVSFREPNTAPHASLETHVEFRLSGTENGIP